jgi:hypothetical protein
MHRLMLAYSITHALSVLHEIIQLVVMVKMTSGKSRFGYQASYRPAKSIRPPARVDPEWLALALRAGPLVEAVPPHFFLADVAFLIRDAALLASASFSKPKIAEYRRPTTCAIAKSRLIPASPSARVIA